MLKKEDLELYERDCGSQIDLLNMQWILRAKKYYNMKPADIYCFIQQSFHAAVRQAMMTHLEV